MSQHWQVDAYERNARFVSTYGRDVVAVLAPRAGERILDVGCGDGVLTAGIAASGATVVGIDASAAFVEAAVARGLDVRRCDAHDLDAESAFDAAFSNAALHWMAPLPPVLANVRRALRPGGRFVGELGGFGNCAAIVGTARAIASERGVAIAEPWTFPAPDDFARDLEDAGLTVTSLTLTPRPTPLPTGMRAWLETFARPLFEDDARRESLYDAIVAALAPSLMTRSGQWTADYVRLRFSAVASA